MTQEDVLAAFKKYNTDKGNTHGYDQYYAEVFKNYTPKSLLEVGVKQGRSICAWRELFPDCDITGLDITDKDFQQAFIDISKAKIIIGDSTKRATLDLLDDNYDIIIDDGSHFYRDINVTFKRLYNRFNHAYIIEDVMYNRDLTVDLIKSYGFNVVECPSKVRNIPVDHCWLETGSYYNGHYNSPTSPKAIVDLYLLIVTK